MVRTRKDDWFVRVQHPNGNWAEPDVVGQPTRNPKVNGLPGVRIPIRDDSKWNDSIWEEQAMEVYYKGERQPIEQFERLERTESTTAIIGRGGIELRNVVDTEYTEEETTTVAEEVITNNSPYTPNVDEVTGGAEQNVQIDTATTTSDFNNRTSGIQNTDPVIISNDELRLAQTNWVFEGEDDVVSSLRAYDFYSDGEATGVGGDFSSTTDDATHTFNVDYTIEDWSLQIRRNITPHEDGDDEAHIPAMAIHVNGEQVIQFADGASYGPTFFDNVQWDSYSQDTDGLSPLTPGQNTIEITIESASYDFSNDEEDGYGEYLIDVISIYDERFNYTFDNEVNSPSGYLDGPELYPDQFDVEFDSVSPARAVAGGRVESSWNSVATNQQVGLSNDVGVTYNTANNTDTFETDFSSAGTTLRFRARLSRYGSRTTATPATGHLGQTIQDYTLYADLQTIPFVINTTLNDRLVDVLNNIAGTGNFVWQFDIDNDGNKTIEFTTNRQRQTVKNLNLNSFSIDKELSNVVEKVIVFGGTNSVARETITANHGTAIQMEHTYIKEGSESVNESNGPASYVRGGDYDINYRTGEITTLSAGNITDGESLDVDYDWKIRSTATVTGATDPRTEVVEIPELTTQELANNIASRLLNELSVLEETVDLSVPATVTDFSAIDALRVEELPTDETFQIKSIQGTPESIEISAGNRESLQDLTEQITSQLKNVSRQS